MHIGDMWEMEKTVRRAEGVVSKISELIINFSSS